MKQLVEEVDEQRFGDFLPENALEADIGERVDESAHWLTLMISCRKVVIYFVRAKESADYLALRHKKYVNYFSKC